MTSYDENYFGIRFRSDGIISHYLPSFKPKGIVAFIKNRIHVGSNILADAEKMAKKKGLDRCTYSEVNVEDLASLKPLVYTSDVVISYVPAFLHIHVAKACLEVGRNLVTASYISNELMALDV